MTDATDKEQLSMVIDREASAGLQDASLPEGYELRRYQLGDEQAWVDLLWHGSFSDWTVEQFLSYIQGPERTEGSYLAVKDGELLAATFASVQHDAPDTGRLDFVVSHSDYRGFGLGRVVCTAVLKHLALREYETTILFTDDWCLPAIGLYLSLGFQPRITSQDMPDRWEAIMHKLNSSR